MFEKNIFNQKMRSMKTFKTLNPEVVQTMEKILGNANEMELFRINPIKFSEAHGLPLDAALDFFIHGAKIGLFNFEWNMLCPSCGGVTNSHHNLGDMKQKEYHCAFCDIDVETDLSDFIEVAFTLSDSIVTIEQDPFVDFNKYREFFFSGNHQFPEEFQKIFNEEVFQGFFPIQPDETQKISFKAGPSDYFRFVSPDVNSLIRLQFTDQPAENPEIIDIDILNSGISPSQVQLPYGDITLHVKSHLNRTTGTLLAKIDYSKMKHKMQMMKKQTDFFTPFITGKQLLNTQSFRDLFRIQSLPAELQLKVSDISIL